MWVCICSYLTQLGSKANDDDNDEDNRSNEVHTSISYTDTFVLNHTHLKRTSSYIYIVVVRIQTMKINSGERESSSHIYTWENVRLSKEQTEQLIV